MIPYWHYILNETKARVNKGREEVTKFITHEKRCIERNVLKIFYQLVEFLKNKNKTTRRQTQEEISEGTLVLQQHPENIKQHR